MVALALLAGCSSRSNTSTAEPVDGDSSGDVAVAVQLVETRTLTRHINLTGQLEPIDQALAVSSTGGEVARVHVNVGDRVQVGQPLLELDFSDELRQLEQQVEQAAAALAAVEATAAEAELALTIAQREHDRMKPLYEAGAISRQQWEQVVDNLERAKLAVDQQVPAQKQQAEAALAQAQRQLEITRKNAVITAPIAGEVAAVNTSVGNFAAPGNPLVTIIQRDRLEIRTDLTDSQIMLVKPGTQVSVTVPGAGPEPFTGEVREVALAVDPTTGKFPVRVEIPNPELQLKPGMYAEITVPVESITDVVAVPSSAIIKRDHGEFAFVVVDNVAYERAVTTGLTDGDYVEIRSGLEAGEYVVVVGNHYLTDGTRVTVTMVEDNQPDREAGQ